MKAGDVCGFVHNRTLTYWLIARWNGDEDTLPVLLDANCRACRPYIESCLDARELLPAEELRALRDELLMLAVSKRGRAAVESALAPPTARQRPGGKLEVLREQLEPSGGRGELPYCQEPLTLTVGFTGTPTKHLIRHIAQHEDPMVRAELALAERNPRWYRVYIEHHYNGERLNQIAERMGTTPNNIYQLHDRAKRFIRSRTEGETHGAA